MSRPNGLRAAAQWSWRRRLDRRGFSIIELMVAIVIMGVALAVAAPNFSRSITNARAQRAQNDLRSDIRLALSTARARGRSVRLDFSDHGYRVIDAGDSTVFRSRDFGGDVGFAASSNPLVFPWGQVEPITLSITCNASQNCQSFSIAPTGRMTTGG